MRAEREDTRKMFFRAEEKRSDIRDLEINLPCETLRKRYAGLYRSLADSADFRNLTFRDV
jgi:hypothetical protein